MSKQAQLSDQVSEQMSKQANRKTKVVCVLFPLIVVSERDSASPCSQGTELIYYAYYVGLLTHGIDTHVEDK